MQGYILIVEDDTDINNMLAELLSLNGWRTVSAFSGTEALIYIRQEHPAAAILDLMLPGMAGEQVLAQVKEESPDTVVIVASAKEDVDTRIRLLQAGADDFLSKPFDTRELLARLAAVIRRSSRNAPGQIGNAGGNMPGQMGAAGRNALGCAGGGFGQEKAVLRYKDITMYPEDFSAFVGEKELPLTRREYLILELLMGNPGKVFTRNNIYESVWNEVFLGEDNAVNVHISNIRQKLGKLHPDESYIQTVWGIGFKMK